MKIILEGVNGSGKSTLAEKLSKILRIQHIKLGPRPINDFEALRQIQNQDQLKEGILDRSTAISHQVYWGDTENIVDLNPSVVFVANRFVHKMVEEGCVFIHLTGKGQNKVKSYYTKKHIENIRKHYSIIRERYEEIFKKIPHLVYDFNKDSVTELLLKIKSMED